MKKIILCIILCLISACTQKEADHFYGDTQNNERMNGTVSDEEYAKQQLADYLHVQSTDAMEIIKQDSSSYVIHISDLELIPIHDRDNEQNYSVFNDGTIMKQTIPEKLIGTWSDNDHIRTYTFTEHTITVSDKELGVYDEAYEITGYEHRWVENKFRSPAEIGGNLIGYYMNWIFDDFFIENPQKSESILLNQHSTFYYEPQTETFEIKGEDMIFTKEEPANDETIYTYKVPHDLIGTWRSEDHMKTYNIDEQTITVYDYNIDINKYTYDITGYDSYKVDSKVKVRVLDGNYYVYRLFWNVDDFHKRYPNACLNNGFFVFYHDLNANTIKIEDIIFTKQE